MTTRNRQYYTLVLRDADGRFYPEFGDYDKECVKFEFQDKLDHGVHRTDLAIIAHRDTHPTLLDKLQQYNAKHAREASTRKPCDGGLDPTWLSPGRVEQPSLSWPHDADVVSPEYFAQRTRSEQPAQYRTEPTLQPVQPAPEAPAAPTMSDAEILARAMNILETRMMATPLARGAQQFTSPTIVRQYLTLQLSMLEHERFDVLFLDTQYRLIAHEGMFNGTISSASVYPREAVKAALRHNASAVILAHNHPSGETEPSDADLRITTRLQDALALVDVKVLDHVIIGGTSSFSFTEMGKL